MSPDEIAAALGSDGPTEIPPHLGALAGMVPQRGRVAVLVTEHETRPSELGPATWITIERADGRRMVWSEVHDTFADRYPGRWAVQVFPPSQSLLANANRYHLWVLDHEPAGLDIGVPA